MVQAIAPLCAAGLMGSTDHTAGGASIILCTAHGFQTIQIDADGKPLPATPQNQQTSCPLCSAMHAMTAFVPPPLALAVAPPTITAARILLISVAVPSRKFSLAYVTRGPPASA
jgi:hypothetical protein